MAARAANELTVRLSSGMSANNTGLPPSAKACPMGRAGDGPTAGPAAGVGPDPTNSAAAPGAQSAPIRERPMAVSIEQARRDRPAPDIAPVPTAGSKTMSLKFEIQPAAIPTPEKDRAARLVDPGFGRVF